MWDRVWAFCAWPGARMRQNVTSPMRAVRRAACNDPKRATGQPESRAAQAGRSALNENNRVGIPSPYGRKGNES